MKRGVQAKTIGHIAAAAALCLMLLATAAPAATPAVEEKASKQQVKRITDLWARGGGQTAKLNARILDGYGRKLLEELSQAQAADLLAQLNSEIKQKAVPFSPAPEIQVPATPYSCVSQFYYGADFYKETMPALLDQLAAGNAKAAIPRLEPWLARYPDSPEVLYGLALAHSAAGDRKEALAKLRRALAAGLPFSRFLAGPRELLAGVYRTREFKDLAKQENALLVHGPQLGAVSDQSASFWLRTAAEAKVTITVRPADAAQTAFEAKGKTAEQSDWTTVLKVKGLAANTLYRYSLTVDGAPVPLEPEPTFRTSPKAGTGGVFSVGFGAKSGYAPGQEGVWDAIAERQLRAFLLLGDGLFVRGQGSPATQRYAHYRRQSSPPFRRFAASTPAYAIWDDNDFAAGKAGSPEVFRQNHANPSLAAGSANPGIWTTFAIGDVTFFMLDCSSQQARPKNAAATMLGAAQKKWLLDGLKKSAATFKVIASAAPWAPSSAWWDPSPTWDQFAAEREEIFSAIESNRIEGVVLLSGGDPNATDVRRIPRSKGYDLYDLHSSRLTNVTEVMTPGGATLNYDEARSFGLLEFDTTLATPRLIYRTIDANGKEVRNHDFVLRPHDLDFEGLPDQDGMAVDISFTKRPLVYGDGTLAEQGMVKVRLENTSKEVQEGTLHLRSVPGSILRFPETPEYMLDPGQAIERTMPVELVNARVNDLIRIYAREGRDALRVGRKMQAPRGKSNGDNSLAAVMDLVNFRFKQTPGHPLLDKEDPQATEMGRIWFAMMDEKLILRVVAFDAAPSRPSGRWTWNLWEGACLEVFGVNRGQEGVPGENIAQIFLIPGVKAIPGTSILGKPMAFRLWRDWFKVKFKSGYEGEPLPEVKLRSEFTREGWIMEAMVPLKLPVFKPARAGVPASISSERKLIHLYADQLRIEFQLSTKLLPDDNFTSHGTMLKNRMASRDTENYAYVEWIGVESWEEKEDDKAEGKEE